MADTRPQGSPASRLTLVLLVCILGCLGVLLYKAFEKPSTSPGEAASAEALALAQPLANTPPIASALSPTNAATPRTETSPPRPGALPAQPVAASRTAPGPATATPPAAAVVVPPAESTTGTDIGPLLRFVAQPTGSEMRIDGTATGKTWACVGKFIAGSFEAEPAWQSDPSLKSVQSLGAGRTPPKCAVSIPIRSLKSQVPVGQAIMDRRMQKEMKAEQFPKIEYRLTEMVLQGEVPASGSPVTFNTKGRLAIAGVTNEVAFPVTMERVGADVLTFKGGCATKMTAFGIAPPEFTIGGIGLKTGDDVTLTWTWRVALQTGAASP
jgi:hypothetical protein